MQEHVAKRHNVKIEHKSGSVYRIIGTEMAAIAALSDFRSHTPKMVSEKIKLIVAPVEDCERHDGRDYGPYWSDPTRYPFDKAFVSQAASHAITMEDVGALSEITGASGRFIGEGPYPLSDQMRGVCDAVCLQLKSFLT